MSRGLLRPFLAFGDIQRARARQSRPAIPSALFRREEASAALEFAILAPLLLLIAAGMIQVGSIVQTAMVVSNAAREGARYAAVSDPNAAQHALSYLQDELGSRTDVTLPALSSIVVSGSTVGEPVTVTVPVSVSVDLPIMSNLLGTSVPVNGTATMEVSQ